MITKKTKKAIFLDVDYIYKNNRTYARLLVKGKKTTRLLYAYDPYFYTDAIEKKEEISKLAIRKNNEIIRIKYIEEVERIFRGEKTRLLKIYCHKPSDVVVLRSTIPFKCYEHGIHYAKRFTMDMNISPFAVLEYEREGKEIKKFITIKESKDDIPLKKLAFDIETYNPLGAPRINKDPIIMISYACKSGCECNNKGEDRYKCKGKYEDEFKDNDENFNNEYGVFTYKQSEKKFVHTSKNESEMILDFCRKINDVDPDLIYGYNSSVFDLPYLKTRAEMLNITFSLGRGRGRHSTNLKLIKKGMINGAKINGRIHLDIYPGIRFFGFIGLIKAQEFTLEKIYEEMTNKKKRMIKRLNIWEMWDSGALDELVEYSLGDSVVTLELGETVLPLFIELSKLTKMPLFDVSLTTSGQLVENLLMHQSQIRGEIIPSKPNESEIIERQRNPIEGAFVKLPEPGIYENIAVFDFRGLYPSIIISYNIDPASLAKCQKHSEHVEHYGTHESYENNSNKIYVSPTGAKFISGPKGVIPSTLERVLNMRIEVKQELKKYDKQSQEYKKLYARSHALKILANSFYGYLGYARSRWYNRQCAESVTAWGRMHIHKAASQAEAAGFKVLYADTDSLFLLLGDKKKEDALAFLDETNHKLPEKMELELENFYSRGVFVSKKQDEKGAKKKYALLAEDGSIKIRGFELVRRDWSKIAKDIQYKVLEIILKEGSKEKAVAAVKETIEKLKGGGVKIEELVIYTQLTKKPENYDIISPELAAAKKAIARGVPLEKGSVIAYVITKSGKSISEKAEIAEYVKEKDYDSDYYINNQVLPAVMKILKELGYNEDDLKNKGRQKNLGHFF
ncbi:MAG: DNA-directed DNA polymerase [Candidatus Micrarchaeota archaeon]